MVGVAHNAAVEHGGELTMSVDLDNLREARRADLAALEARRTWRFAGAMLAQTLAILGVIVAIPSLIEQRSAGNDSRASSGARPRRSLHAMWGARS